MKHQLFCHSRCVKGWLCTVFLTWTSSLPSGAFQWKCWIVNWLADWGWSLDLFIISWKSTACKHEYWINLIVKKMLIYFSCIFCSALSDGYTFPLSPLGFYWGPCWKPCLGTNLCSICVWMSWTGPSASQQSLRLQGSGGSLILPRDAQSFCSSLSQAPPSLPPNPFLGAPPASRPGACDERRKARGGGGWGGWLALIQTLALEEEKRCVCL